MTMIVHTIGPLCLDYFQFLYSQDVMIMWTWVSFTDNKGRGDSYTVIIFNKVLPSIKYEEPFW